MGERNRTTILSALLDFYSDRAVAHASFLVAIVLGLFTILSLRKEVSSVFSFGLYWLFSALGLYSFLNFGLYAEFAERTKNEMINPSRETDCVEQMIIQETQRRWKGLLIKRAFLWTKFPEMQKEKAKSSEEKKSRRLKDFLFPAYFFLTFSISWLFFPKVSSSIFGLIIFMIPGVVFSWDLLAIARSFIPRLLGFTRSSACEQL